LIVKSNKSMSIIHGTINHHGPQSMLIADIVLVEMVWTLTGKSTDSI
jgi:hypothetical protein